MVRVNTFKRSFHVGWTAAREWEWWSLVWRGRAVEPQPSSGRSRQLLRDQTGRHTQSRQAGLLSSSHQLHLDLSCVDRQPDWEPVSEK